MTEDAKAQNTSPNNDNTTRIDTTTKNISPKDPIETEADVIAMWENEANPPTVTQICRSLDTTDIRKTPEWSSRVSLKAKRNMVNYFRNRVQAGDCSIAPWFFFVLAKHFELSSTTIKQILEEYANSIQFRKNGFLFAEGSKFSGEFQSCNIDPRWWFGNLTQMKRLPQFYSKILEARFTQLKSEYPDGTVFEVSATGRFECELPNNFHLNLITHLQNLKMFTVCYETCPILKNAFFSRCLGEMENKDVTERVNEFQGYIFEF